MSDKDNTERLLMCEMCGSTTMEMVQLARVGLSDRVLGVCVECRTPMFKSDIKSVEGPLSFPSDRNQ